MSDETRNLPPMPNEVEEQANSIRPFGMRDKVGYALGDLGCNLSFALVGTYMMNFYMQYLGLGAALWAVIIILTKIWDGIDDPIMGHVMDRVRIKIFGIKSKFKTWIALGMIALPIATCLVFLPIKGAPTWAVMLVGLVSYLIWDFFYTIVNVPYGSLNNSISADRIERTQLSSWRTIGSYLGAGLCMLLPMFLFRTDTIGSGEEATKVKVLLGERFIWIAIILGVVSIGCYLGTLLMTTERVKVEEEKEPKKFNLGKAFMDFIHNRPLIAMCISSVALFFLFTSNTSTVTWIMQTYFAAVPNIFITVSGIIPYIPTILLLPFVKVLTKKFGKKAISGLPLILSIVMAIAGLFIPYPQTTVGAIIYLLVVMVIQTGGTMHQLVCWAMITDCVDYDEIRTGERKEGSVYSMFTLFRKIAQGLALGLLPVFFLLIGFDNSQLQVAGYVVSSETGMNMIKLSIGLQGIGAVIMALSLILLYPLSKKKVIEQGEILGRTSEVVDLQDALQNKNE